jgi:hypothetical protein
MSTQIHTDGGAVDSPTDDLGPSFAVLDEPTRAALPAYVGPDERVSLGSPSRAFDLAALTAGRLLRVTDVRAAGRKQIERWLEAFDPEAIAVLGGYTEQLSIDGLRLLYQVVSYDGTAASLLGTPLGVGPPEVDSEPAPATGVTTDPPGPGWAGSVVTLRDDAESLLVLLGVLAMRHEREDLTSTWEARARQQALGLDHVARRLFPVLGDGVPAELPDSAWLDRVARLEDDAWWLGWVEARRAERLAGARREARVISFHRRREATAEAQAHQKAADAIERGDPFREGGDGEEG